VIKNTVIMDYSNEPDIASHAQLFDKIVLSPRSWEENSPEISDLEDRVIFWVQPVIHLHEGKPALVSEYDERCWKICGNGSYVLKDSQGKPLSIEGSDISQAYVMDLTLPYVAKSWYQLLREISGEGKRELLFDYGTWDLNWESSLRALKEPQTTWMRWGFNYSWIKSRFPDSFVQTNKPISNHPVVLEKAGWTLNPITMVHLILQARRGCMVLADNPDDKTRETLSALCYIYDGIFSLNRDSLGPEQIDWRPGTWHDTEPRIDKSEVIYRRTKYDVVVYNPTAEPKMYRMTQPVLPNEGRIII